MGRHLEKDKRGVSNIIVVVLSLIIIVVIVANVILWSYQMNQIDWEKMQETISIENVTRGTSAQTLYAHQETTTIGTSTYYRLRLNSADASGTTLSDSAKNDRKLLGKFVYNLQGVSSIPASTWTFYYRAYSSGTLSHIDVDIIIRKSDDTVRASWNHVANSSDLGTAYSTVSATYAWASYTVVDQTDYLEIDYYHHNTATTEAPRTAYLRIDDSALAITDQTRVTSIVLPSEYDARFTFKNKGALTSHIVSLWIINSTYHQRCSVDIFLNSGQTLSYSRVDIRLPNGQYIVKIVTERGNTAVYSEG